MSAKVYPLQTYIEFLWPAFKTKVGYIDPLSCHVAWSGGRVAVHFDSRHNAPSARRGLLKVEGKEDREFESMGLTGFGLGVFRFSDFRVKA